MFIALDWVRKDSNDCIQPRFIHMVEGWHRSLKASVMLHNNAKWVDALPTVLLGLRTSVKGDTGATAAELVYGPTPTNRRIFPQWRHVARPEILRRKISRNHAEGPTSTKHHGTPKVFIHKNLFTSILVPIKLENHSIRRTILTSRHDK